MSRIYNWRWRGEVEEDVRRRKRWVKQTCEREKINVDTCVITLFLPLRFSRVSAPNRDGPNWAEFDPKEAQLHQKVLRTWPGAYFSKFGKVWPVLTKFDRDHDQVKRKIWLTTFWPLSGAYQEFRFDILRVENGQETRELWAKQ